MNAQVEPARVDAVAAQLYALLPAELRTADAQGGYPLKALVKVLAGGTAEIDAEIDRLYTAQFVETAPEDLLAGFAALVSAELLRPLPPGADENTRAYIANTIRYRRGKGTARVLEALATDVGGFAAVAVEYFQRLARTQNLIDIRPDRPGTGSLVDPQTAARSGTARDMLPRLIDVRSIARAGGRHHIPHVGVHLLQPVVPFFPAPAEGEPLTAEALSAVPVARPWQDGATVLPGYFQLSAHNGRTLRLFNPDRRSQTDGGRAIETDLADRLRRLPLHAETCELREAAAEGRAPHLPEFPWFDELGRPFALFERKANATDFTRIPPAQIRICMLEDLPTPSGSRPAATLTHNWGWDDSTTPPAPRTAAMPIRCGFDPVNGRLIMAKPGTGEADVAEVRIAYGTGIGRPIGAGAQNRAAADMPMDVTDTDLVKHFICVVDATVAAASGVAAQSYRTVPTLAQALAEWEAQGAGLRGLILLVHCDRAAGDVDLPIQDGQELQIASGQWQPVVPQPGVPTVTGRRGFVIRATRRFTIDGAVTVRPAAGAGGAGAGSLLIDGIEITGGLTLADGAASHVRLRHVTLRNPGGVALGSAAPLLECTIAAEGSILGRIAPTQGVTGGSSRIILTDCVVSADEAGGEAIAAPDFEGELQNVTVFGPVHLRSVDATNVIFFDGLEAERTQEGCLRYSYVIPASKQPRRFRCQPELALATARTAKGSPLTPDEQQIASLRAQPRFLDTALDEPTLAMLHPQCSDAIRLGGEGEAEIGVFALSAERLRQVNVAQFFDDYLPFGLEAGLIDDTRSSAVAVKRNRP